MSTGKGEGVAAEGESACVHIVLHFYDHRVLQALVLGAQHLHVDILFLVIFVRSL
jgi:hypothetical protein